MGNAVGSRLADDDPVTEERIRQAIRRALLYLQNIDITRRLAVVDEDKIRIRSNRDNQRRALV